MIVAGIAWFYGEIYWIGLVARWIHSVFHLNSTSTSLHLLIVSELSTVLIQLIPSLIIAWLVSLIRPKQWLLYSGLVIFPTILLSVITLVRYGLPGNSIYWISYLIGLCALLVQVPLLLFLFYSVGNKGNFLKNFAKQAQ